MDCDSLRDYAETIIHQYCKQKYSVKRIALSSKGHLPVIHLQCCNECRRFIARLIEKRKNSIWAVEFVTEVLDWGQEEIEISIEIFIRGNVIHVADWRRG